VAIFVCGTDTGVGKTHSAAAILYKLRGMRAIKYWKPIQTGTDTDIPDETMVRKLTGLPDEYFVPTTLTFRAPLSPHRAAELENRSIEIDSILQILAKLDDSTIIEGAGGLLVPINRRETWLDFLRQTRLAVVIAARTGLGTINHSLLTIDSLLRANIPIAGMIYCGPANPDNARTIHEFTSVPDLGSFDYRTREDFETIDPENHLRRYLGNTYD